jgi:CDP-6-deoxy-D-xylo-4-hexulose-3-dehydrase
VDEFQSKFVFYELAYNLRPTEITGFLGNVQLPHLEEHIALRRRNHFAVMRVIAANDDFVPMRSCPVESLSPFATPVLCRTPGLRARYVARLAEAGVESRPIIGGDIQRQPFFEKYAASYSYELPGARLVHECGFYVSCAPDMTGEQVETVARCLARE